MGLLLLLPLPQLLSPAFNYDTAAATAAKQELFILQEQMEVSALLAASSHLQVPQASGS
jgi:hypothetical protein